MTLEIDPRTLINEVEQRTPLYDTSTKKYHDRNLKKKLWDEVCQEVYSSSVWDAMSSQDKAKYGKEVQKRWTSLRHCFRRELATQRNIPSGSTAHKKRKYMYFDALLFLLPFTDIVNTEGSIENAEHDEKEISNSENEKDVTFQAKTEFLKPKTVRKNHDEEIIALLKEGNQILCNSNTSDNQQDDDELFLRSLIPYIKEFSGDQKLLLRIEIIKSILNFKQSLNNSSICPQTNLTPSVSNATPSSTALTQNYIGHRDSANLSENLEFTSEPSPSQSSNNSSGQSTED